MSGLSRSLEQAGRWVFAWQPHQVCGCCVPVPWGSSSEVPNVPAWWDILGVEKGDVL